MKIQRKYFIIISSLFIVFVLDGCSKWLNINPDSGIVRDTYWKSESDVEGAVMGCYASLLDASMTEKMFVWGELRADMVVAGDGCLDNYKYMMAQDISPTSTLTQWATFYSTINYCNTVLKYAQEARKVDKEFTADDLKAYEAEALGIRSLMYFYLVRTFSDVPLITYPTDNDRVNLYVACSKQKVVLQQIENDLRLAAKNALSTYGSTAEDKGRFTSWGIKSLLASVYLWDEKYDSCVMYCEDIRQNSGIDLYQTKGRTDYNWFLNVFANGNSTESLFELEFYDQKLNPFYSYFSTKTGKYFKANLIFDGVFPTASDDDGDSIDIRNNTTYVYSADGYILKYLILPGGVQGKSEKSYQHWIVLRYADVLLDEAEALAVRGNAGDIDLANELITYLRVRRMAPPSQASHPTTSDGLLSYILEERNREFLYEGKRWFDLLRYIKRDNFKQTAKIEEVMNKVIASDKVQGVINKFSDPWFFYLPIYQGEIDVNTLLVQNEFYTR